MSEFRKGDVNHTLDLTDPYYQITLALLSLPFVGANVGNLKDLEKGLCELFGYRTLPFGIRTAVFIFTKMLAHFVNFLNLFMRARSYIDDIRLTVGNSLVDSQETIQRRLELAYKTAVLLGLKVSKKNSNLLDTSSDFIGFTTEAEKIKPTRARFLSTIDAICEIIGEETTTIGSLRSVAGKIASFKATFPAVSILHRFVKRTRENSGQIRRN